MCDDSDGPSIDKGELPQISSTVTPTGPRSPEPSCPHGNLKTGAAVVWRGRGPVAPSVGLQPKRRLHDDRILAFEGEAPTDTSPRPPAPRVCRTHR